MLNFSLKYIVRSLRRNRIYSIFSIVSLGFGFLCCLLAYLYINHETSYDHFFDHPDEIVRMEYIGSPQPEESERFATLPGYFLPPQLNSIPGISSFTRLAPLPDLFIEAGGNNKIKENNAFAADSGFFEVLDFEILEGNSSDPLSQPTSIVLTEKAAQKYFNTTSAIGKTLDIYHGQQEVRLTVTAVMENVPSNSHLDFGLLIDSNSYEDLFGSKISSAYRAFEYLRLAEGSSIAAVEKKLSDIKPELDNAPDYEFSYELQPISDIHLHSSVRGEIKPTSDIRYLYFFAIITAIILIVSVINYVSLFLSHALDRDKEIRVRKVLGANNSSLVLQLLLESILVSVLALVTAYLLAYWSLPMFNDLTGKFFIAEDLLSWELLLGSTGLAVFIGLISVIYPAWSLLKGRASSISSNRSSDRTSNSFQHSVIVLQFIASIILIICTLVVYNQLNFISNKDLGFKKERIVTADNSLNDALPSFKAILNKHPGIEYITASSYIPGTSETGGTGPVTVVDNGQTATFNWVSVDYSFFNSYEIPLTEGRLFSRDFASDSTSAFIINQKAAERLGLDNPVGKRINAFDRSGEIIGIVEDFNYLSLHKEVPPMVFFIDEDYYFSLSVVLANNSSLNAAIEDIKSAWYSLKPNVPFDYSFLDEQYKKLYESEQNMGRSFLAFSIIAIFICSLGLFSMAAYSVQKRTKEIGIRKVLGATVPNILSLLYKKYLKLILLSFIIALPVSYFFLGEWLNSFAFKVNIGVSPAMYSLLITIFFTVIAVSYWALKAAYSNPTDSIRNE